MRSQSLFNKQKERAWMLGRVVYCLYKQPFLALGFTFYWVWVNMAYQIPWVYRSVELTSGFLFPTRLAPIFISFATHLAMSLWFKRTNAVVRKRWYMGFLAVLVMLGSLVSILWARQTTTVSQDGSTINIALGTPEILFIVLLFGGSFLIGFSSACLCIELQRIFGSLGSQYVLLIGCVAMLASTVFLFALSFLAQTIQDMIFVLVPLAMVICLYRTLDRVQTKTFFSHGLKTELIIPYKFLITAFLHGLSLGILLGLPLMQQIGFEILFGSIFSYGAAALLLLLLSITMKMDYNHLIYQVGFPIVAIGSLMLVCALDTPLWGMLVQLMGFCFLHLVMWGVCAHLIKGLNLPATWVIAVSTCAFMLGQLLGGIVSSYFGQFESSALWVQRISAIMICIILLSSLFMVSNQNLRTGWGLARIDSNENPENDDDLVVQGIIAEFELTNREATILPFLIRGRNRRAISEELMVSEETVKSHTQHIYQKLSIHSQQELISLFDKRK